MDKNTHSLEYYQGALDTLKQMMSRIEFDCIRTPQFRKGRYDRETVPSTEASMYFYGYHCGQSDVYDILDNGRIHLIELMSELENSNEEDECSDDSQ